MGVLGPAGPSLERWGTIVPAIAEGLEQVREVWFEQCIKMIRRISHRANPDNPPVTPRRTALGGEAIYAIKAFQLFLLLKPLEDYIAPGKFTEFADVLVVEVWGEDFGECRTRFSRYSEFKDPKDRLLCFGTDVAKYIMGGSLHPFVTAAVASMVPLLFEMSHMFLAGGFGDNDTVDRLSKKIDARLMKSPGPVPSAG